jgi:opacity protein-like surface antigen
LFDVSGSQWRIGWTFGGRVEAMLTPNWSLKVEYLHVDLGTGILFNIVPGFPERITFETEIVRAGLNYRFDWGAPPVLLK